MGAAIVSKEGATLATGRNDVPKYGGGLYAPEDGAGDERCCKSGRYCRNTTRKIDLKAKIKTSVASLRDASYSQKFRALSDDEHRADRGPKKTEPVTLWTISSNPTCSRPTRSSRAREAVASPRTPSCSGAAPHIHIRYLPRLACAFPTTDHRTTHT